MKDVSVEKNSEVLLRVAPVKLVRVDRFRFGDGCGDECFPIKADAGDKGASPSCSWDADMEGAAGRDLRRTDEDFDVLPVGVHLNSHLVHVEDEAWWTPLSCALMPL